jgi:transposase
VDAESLARLARLDPRLLRAIEHRSEQAQVDRALLRSRDVLVRTRSSLISHLRGTVKALGSRLPSCSAESFAKKAAEAIPEPLQPALGPVVEQIAALTQRIRGYDRQLAQVAAERYPEHELLCQVDGVGVLTSLAYMLRLEDPRRFRRSRTVGAYLGLVPKRQQSGDRDPQLRISKHGDAYVRRLLVNCAHYILGPFGKDCELRRYGERIAARGGKNAKKRAAVAVARKLAVLLHRLWRDAEVYEPFHDLEQEAA